MGMHENEPKSAAQTRADPEPMANPKQKAASGVHLIGDPFGSFGMPRGKGRGEESSGAGSRGVALRHVILDSGELAGKVHNIWSHETVGFVEYSSCADGDKCKAEPSEPQLGPVTDHSKMLILIPQLDVGVAVELEGPNIELAPPAPGGGVGVVAMACRGRVEIYGLYQQHGGIRLAHSAV
ncbi:hypothetical protein C8R46DRAFT_1037795 [Mycena filopes]|nr:hypothetical protein C8R46DRAFT_1037795 [Mycena filopes]